MTDQFPPAVGTVAQEAARLIEDMATMARSSYGKTEEPTGYAGPPAGERESAAACSMCGAERESAHGYDSYDGYDNSDLDDGQQTDTDPDDRDPKADPNDPLDSDGQRDRREIPTTCKLCPLCKGIELLRTVRPETVDLLADLALSMATTLRDVAKRSRETGHGSSGSAGSGASAPADRPTVQDILVNDETEG